MEKRSILFLVTLVSILVAFIGLMGMGLEILEHMDPDRMILWAVVTAIGLAGMLAGTILRLALNKK